MKTKTIEKWEERFDKEVKKLDEIGAMYHKFGYKTRIRHIDGSKEIYTVTDWGNVKKFIHEVLSDQKKEIREKIKNIPLCYDDGITEPESEMDFIDGQAHMKGHILKEL